MYVLRWMPQASGGLENPWAIRQDIAEAIQVLLPCGINWLHETRRYRQECYYWAQEKAHCCQRELWYHQKFPKLYDQQQMSKGIRSMRCGGVKCCKLEFQVYPFKLLLPYLLISKKCMLCQCLSNSNSSQINAISTLWSTLLLWCSLRIYEYFWVYVWQWINILHNEDTF